VQVRDLLAHRRNLILELTDFLIALRRLRRLRRAVPFAPAVEPVNAAKGLGISFFARPAPIVLPKGENMRTARSNI